ncbi:MAG: aldehyde dehydrogenase family protein [Gemmatimonadetes bacterium]|nr:aldehyde dehydrogenase family protein [Gemmatimonadota bacterium]
MHDLLKRLGIADINPAACHSDWVSGGETLIPSVNPASGEPIASVRSATADDFEAVVASAHARFKEWRMVPAPARGELVRLLGEELRRHKEDLGALVALEMGKIRAEGEGEVQEMIDICDFSVGLSRQLYGNTMHSERPGHRMYEQWHPLGVVGVISAFNFPVAVWAWNAAIAAVCGDTVVWKPSSKTPLTAVAVQHICNRVTQGTEAEGVFGLAVGDRHAVGGPMLGDRRIPLISATGSCSMGRRVGEAMARRLARAILELGGNNGIIVTEDADLEMATRAIVFGAVGTAGQRCTSTRRIIMQRSIAEDLTNRILRAYEQVRIGDPLDPDTLMGPLLDQDAVDTMMKALDEVRAGGGEILTGGKTLDRPGFFVEPTVCRVRPDLPIVREETFAPILYLLEYETLDEAIEIHNGVDQGLSSSIFTTNLLSAETFLSHRGSDCGIANANIGTSGAEIGGAFGGEKDTGGGREAGSDSWKMYMRRQTCTTNWSRELPLAQGIVFGD